MILRSLLFLPGNTPKMLEKGPFLEADALILDLEDAVSPREKDAARVLVRNALRVVDFRGKDIIVRINAPGLDSAWQEDIREIVLPGLTMIMIPKAEDGETIRQVAEKIGTAEKERGIPTGNIRLIPLIETCRGIEHAYEIATVSRRIYGLFLGAEDLTADMRCKRTREGSEILFARMAILNAARAAGVEAFDTPFTDVNDLDGLLADAQRARVYGYSGKASISPRHLEIINQVFSPSAEEIQYAREVVEAIEAAEKSGKGVVAVRGKMVDKPVVLRARQTLDLARQINGGWL